MDQHHRKRVGFLGWQPKHDQGDIVEAVAVEVANTLDAIDAEGTTWGFEDDPLRVEMCSVYQLTGLPQYERMGGGRRKSNEKRK